MARKKRSRSHEEGDEEAAQKPIHYSVNKHLLATLGGGWVNMPPFAGDEDKLYRWMAEPALWQCRSLAHSENARHFAFDAASARRAGLPRSFIAALL